MWFNDTYIGDASTVKELDLSGQLLELLEVLACTVSLPFPPSPDAAMVKVTDDTAFSSQPTVKQMVGLRPFGFVSVINLRVACERGVEPTEADECTKNGVSYFSCSVPCVLDDATDEDVMDVVAAVERALRAHHSAPKPVLIHCDSGKRSCAVVLVYAARAMRADFKQVLRWGLDLGHDLSDLRWLSHSLLLDVDDAR